LSFTAFEKVDKLYDWCLKQKLPISNKNIS